MDGAGGSTAADQHRLPVSPTPKTNRRYAFIHCNITKRSSTSTKGSPDKMLYTKAVTLENLFKALLR